MDMPINIAHVRALDLFTSLLGRQAAAAPIPEGIMPPPRTAASASMAPSRALTLDAVYRCVSVIQTAAKQLSLDAWRGSDRLEGDAYPRLLSSPSADATQVDLIADTVASLALRGNAYWLIGRSSDGRPASIRVLDPLECVPSLTAYTGERSTRWAGRVYDASQIRHLRLVRVPGQALGVGPIQACASTLVGASDMAAYASQWTAGAGVPTGTLTTDQPITAEQAAEAKKRWNDNASHAGGVAVLGAGMRYTPIALKPSEVQFLESRAFDVLAIGRMFGIPAHMLLASVDGSSMTYQNINDAATDFIRWTVMTYLREIEDTLTAILPRGTTARFNLDALLRADAKTRMDTHAVAIAAGIYDAATAAAIEGLPTPTPKETKNEK